MLKRSYISLHKENEFINQFVLSAFEEQLSHIKELNDFVSYLTKNLKSLEMKTGWFTFFLPFKRIVKTLMFIDGYITSSKDFIGKTEEQKYQKWFDLSDRLEELITELGNDSAVVNKLNELLKTENNEKNKSIINVWLHHFFDNQLNKNTKRIYKLLLNSLNEKTEIFEKNGIENAWEKSAVISITPHQRYMLKGLDEEMLKVGRSNAKEEHKDGWLFYAEEGTTEAILEKAKSRPFRRKSYQAYQKLNSGQSLSYNNDKILRNIISIKQQIAHLHKKENYAKLVLSNYVLNTPEKAYTYLDNIENELIPLVNNMENEIKEQANKDGIKILKNWDIPFYINEIRKTIYANEDDDTTFSNYFIFENVLENFFKFLKKEFSLSIKEVKREEINENLLITYQFTDLTTQHSGLVLFSPFNNENKTSASQSELCGNERVGRSIYLPSVEYITLPLEKNEKKQKMSFHDMIVLLHEFGHALHSFYADRNDTFLNESLISWDLIELPSQFIEHLIYDIEFMQKMSCHYRTKKKIGKKLLKKAIEKEQSFKPYETYKEIKKYNAQLWLYENFKQYSQKSPHEIVNERIGHNGLIYNITRDNYMVYNDHLKDYAPSGYIYLYSAKIAHNLLKSYKGNMKEVFTKLFNSDKIIKVEHRLHSVIDINNIDMVSFFKKGWDIKLYGENNKKNEGKND